MLRDRARREGAHAAPVPELRTEVTYAYAFTGVECPAAPLPDVVAPLLEWTNAATGREFDQALVNWYRDGRDYVGPHSDAEPAPEPGAPVASVSLGSARTFRLRGAGRVDLRLGDGDVVVMAGDTQREFTHEVVRERRASDAGRRVSVTFRIFRRDATVRGPDTLESRGAR